MVLIVAWDNANGKSMLVRFKVGKGYVYTFALWAYPGHEKFQKFSAVWIEKLASETISEIYVKDTSKEVFWTVWKNENETTVMLLNTDWAEKDNVKTVEIVTEKVELPVEVKERTLVIATVKDEEITVFEYSL